MVKSLNKSEVESVLTSESLVIIKAGAEWCGPCKLIKPILDRVSEREDISKVDIFDMDVEEGDNKTFLSEMGIRSIPTMLFYKNGKLVDTHSGLLDEKGIIEKINNKLLQN